MVKSAFHGPKSRGTVHRESQRAIISDGLSRTKVLGLIKLKNACSSKNSKLSFYIEEVFSSVIMLFNKGNYIHANHYGVYENNCIRNQSVNMQMAHHAND